jgi:predicted secreted hydrolase
MQRRLALIWLGSGAAASGLLTPMAAHALPPKQLAFPRDHGAHPDFRTEWWYITGHGKTSAGRELGFQVTFFRSRVSGTQDMRSAFAAKQLIFAHAAITDVQNKKLHHDQRSARAGFGIAHAREQDTDIRLRDWQLARQESNKAKSYTAQIKAQDFELQLRFEEIQPLLLQGQNGLSRKGPQERQASYYYSKPHLQTSGSIVLKNESLRIEGTAWLDHEWSEEILHPQAKGWDWVGMNLFDGSALTAFQLRRADGSAVWTGGSFRSSPATDLQRYIASPGEVAFQAKRTWVSPLTRAKYPVEWLVRTPADFYTIKAVVDNQELDSRSSTGAIYWEGLSDCFDSNGKHVGRGYLEMTGYAAPLLL